MSVINIAIVLCGLFGFYYGAGLSDEIESNNRTKYFLIDGGKDTLNNKEYFGKTQYSALKNTLFDKPDYPLQKIDAAVVLFVKTSNALFAAYGVKGLITTQEKAVNKAIPAKENSPDIGVHSVGVDINITGQSLFDSMDVLAAIIRNNPFLKIDRIEFKGTQIITKGLIIGAKKEV